MNISVTQAARDWGISRTTIYHKISNGELSRSSDKKIDVSEMLRVFGEPPKDEQSKSVLNKTMNTVQKTPLNTSTEQLNTLKMEHKLEVEKLRNEHLEQQVDRQQALIEDYQQQIRQLNKSLAQATASINEFAQTRLLELRVSQTNLNEQSPQEQQVDKTLQKENEDMNQSNKTTKQNSAAVPSIKKKKWRWW